MKVTENKVNIPFTKLSLYAFVDWLKTFFFVLIQKKEKKRNKNKDMMRKVYYCDNQGSWRCNCKVTGMLIVDFGSRCSDIEEGKRLK